MKIVKFQSSYDTPYPLQVEGESYHRDEIEEVTGYMGEDEGINADDFIAHLILDNRNLNDANAVAVEIDGKTVGNLSRPNAKRYRAKLLELGLSDVVGECYASIRGGGFKNSTGEQIEFGVRLDIDLDELKVEPPPKPRTTQPGTPPITSAPTAQPQAASIPSQPVQKKTPIKIPFIPMQGKGWLYYLFVLPIIASLNLLILLIAGIGIGFQFLAKRLANIRNTKQ